MQPLPKPARWAFGLVGLVTGIGLSVGAQVLLFMVAMSHGAPEIPGGNRGMLIAAGLFPWLLVAPAALLAHVFRLHSLAKGLWVGGAVGALLATLCWWSIAGPGPATPTPAPTPNPFRGLHVEGLVTEVALPRLVVQRPDGSQHTLQLTPQTKVQYYGDWAAPKTPAAATMIAVGRKVDTWSDVGTAGNVVRDIYLWVEPSKSPGPSPR